MLHTSRSSRVWFLYRFLAGSGELAITRRAHARESDARRLAGRCATHARAFFSSTLFAFERVVVVVVVVVVVPAFVCV